MQTSREETKREKVSINRHGYCHVTCDWPVQKLRDAGFNRKFSVMRDCYPTPPPTPPSLATR